MVGERKSSLLSFILSGTIGVLVSLALSIGLLSVLTSLIMNQSLTFGVVTGVCIGIHFLCVYAGGFIAGRIGKGNALLTVGLVVAVSLLIHLVLGGLVFNSGLGNLFAVVIPELLSGLLAVVTLNKCGRKHNRGKIKKRYL